MSGDIPNSLTKDQVTATTDNFVYLFIVSHIAGTKWGLFYHEAEMNQTNHGISIAIYNENRGGRKLLATISSTHTNETRERGERRKTEGGNTCGDGALGKASPGLPACGSARRRHLSSTCPRTPWPCRSSSRRDQCASSGERAPRPTHSAENTGHKGRG
jgi:hypothetical protein